jgi:hypothetical protein
MTSIRKLNANRLNGKKSRGPKTTAGKLIASRNALRHGFAASKDCVPLPKTDIEQFATALCGKADNRELFQQALIIAENELVLRAISEQQLAVIERLRDPSVVPFSQRDNTLRLMRARVRKRKEAEKTIKVLRDALLKKYESQLPAPFPEDNYTKLDALFPAHLEEFLAEKESEQVAEALASDIIDVREADCILERDDGAALEMAIKDLMRLDRYQRRASSCQRRAIFAFIGLKTTAQCQPSEV